MNAATPIHFSVDAGGVGWIEFDDAGAAANVLTERMQDALAETLARAQADAQVQALVLASGKAHVFLAGADLNVVAGLADARAATEFSWRGQQLAQRIADCRVPVVAALHGACAGGGFELALACHGRIASEAPETRLGLPETSFGTIPGWGGTVRLSRLIGPKRALDHLWQAQLVPASSALESGMVDALVTADQLRARAREAALRMAQQPVARPAREEAPDAALFNEFRQAAKLKAPGNQQALLAAIDVVEAASRMTLEDALRVEARTFGEVTASRACRNLIRAFFLREAARKRTLAEWFPTDRTGETPASIRKLGVVGAGVMGSGIAHWAAVHGFDVVLRDVNTELVERGLAAVRRLLDESVQRRRLTAGEANAALHRIAVTTQWEGFAQCDLVVEAIVENTAAKRALFSEIAAVVPPTTILASNTSALPIEEIAGHVPHSGRTLGIHFFNPVSRMALVELVLGPQTAAAPAWRALEWVKALGKLPVVCRSAPGFVVTRVLFFYLNAAVRRCEEGVAPAELDAAMREFGWPMGPLRLIDEVGVDVSDSIFRELEHYHPDRFTRTRTCEHLLARGLRGRKNGASHGFYHYEGRTERMNDGVFPVASTASTPGAKTRESIARELMAVMVDEARRCVEEGVVKSAGDVDFALISGAGFPAFRGGLMHWAQTGSQR